MSEITKEEILSKVDHTLLKQQSTWEQIKKILDEGMEAHTASACIPPCFVKRAAEYVNGQLPICTVIGFPNGNMTTEVKVFETSDAVKNGADEIDMVINVGLVKEGRYDDIKNEINEVKKACDGRILKVIIETCLLTDSEKIKMCETVNESEADFIKTSTGFSEGGATFEDIALMKKYMNEDKKIKAAGGISSVEDAVRFIELGADRLGTSRLIALLK